MSAVSPLPSLPRATLVLGGARSGKSRRAEALLVAAPEKVYVATGQAFDAEMAARIAGHRARRGAGWATVEEPLDLPGVLAGDYGGRPLLVDCLTLWLSNLLLADRDPDAATAALEKALATLAGPVILVANEVGLSIVPENALARRFRDAAGVLNQRVAAACDRVEFIAAGLPLVLKG
jgi:adenosyl cobinamide kinase/adenosyl cobinamide phosphate guanylyltransferase